MILGFGDLVTYPDRELKFLPPSNASFIAETTSRAKAPRGFLRKLRRHDACIFKVMDKEELQERSMAFASGIRTITLRVRAIPDGRNASEQLLASSSSMAANYRAACRARSTAEFISKLGTVVEESDESVYWLEYIVKGGFLRPIDVAPHLDEAKQLRAIFAASYGTARSNYHRRLEEERRSKKKRRE